MDHKQREVGQNHTPRDRNTVPIERIAAENRSTQNRDQKDRRPNQKVEQALGQSLLTYLLGLWSWNSHYYNDLDPQSTLLANVLLQEFLVVVCHSLETQIGQMSTINRTLAIAV